MMIHAKNVDEYIASCPEENTKQAEHLRNLIRKAAPKAEETISYGMPAYKLNGVLVYFAINAKHIGFYPLPSAIAKFRKELAAYKTSKGTVQFPLDARLPATLISRMVKFRVQENEARKAKKKK